MPRSGFLHNGVPIPVPPMDVLQIGDKRIENGNHRIYLVLFFDTKRTWYVEFDLVPKASNCLFATFDHFIRNGSLC